MTRSITLICAALVGLGAAYSQQPSPQSTPGARAQIHTGVGRVTPPTARPVVTPQPQAKTKGAAQQQTGQTQVPQKQAASQQQPQAIPVTPGPTPVSLEPMRPADMPPVPPQVTFRDGMLTVQAPNSTMASLLQAIRNKTGIQFEGAEFATGRVAIATGPAPEAEVLASILGGSALDYVILGREDSPNIVQRVILTPKKNTAAAAHAGAQPPQPAEQPQEGGDEEVPDEQNGAADAEQPPQDTPAQPPEVNAQQQQQQQQQEQNQQPKTPDQLLQELKEMQQKQQQDQGGQTPSPGQVPRKPPQ